MGCVEGNIQMTLKSVTTSLHPLRDDLMTNIHE